MDFLRGLDAFPKLKAEDTVRTTHGACASLCALFFMAYLFASEFSFYRKVDVVDRLIVNSTHGEHLRVAFDVTFPHIPCDLLSLDALDTAGQPQVGVEHRVSKQQLRAEVPGGPRLVVKRDKIITLGTVRDEAHFEKHAAEKAEEHESVMKTGGGEGKEPGDPKAIVGLEGKCGNCYGAGALGECCNSCEAVRIAYAKKGWIFNPEGVSQCSVERAASGFQAAQDQSTGCQLHGDVDLTTVNGNFHFAPHASAAHGPGLGGLLTITELLAQTFASFNVTHEVTSLSFGDHYPGIMNPLDGQRRTVQDGHGMYQYYIKVVPTVYKYLDGRQVVSNQYSVTEHLRHITPGAGRGLPGVWFFYEVSPIHAIFEETRRSTLEFISSVCAILGGVFTIVGVADRGLDAIVRKLSSRELGR